MMSSSTSKSISYHGFMHVNFKMGNTNLWTLAVRLMGGNMRYITILCFFI